MKHFFYDSQFDSFDGGHLDSKVIYTRLQGSDSLIERRVHRFLREHRGKLTSEHEGSALHDWLPRSYL
jgi:hypothetical protein